ncbi:hypothetical protein AgCh_009407 [Apium graveolens]
MKPIRTRVVKKRVKPQDPLIPKVLIPIQEESFELPEQNDDHHDIDLGHEILTEDGEFSWGIQGGSEGKFVTAHQLQQQQQKKKKANQKAPDLSRRILSPRQCKKQAAGTPEKK